MRIDPKNIYSRLADRYRKLAREAPGAPQGTGAVARTVAAGGATRAAEPLRKGLDWPHPPLHTARPPALDATLAERARLKTAFALAQERGHVPTALALLEQDASARQIECAIGALPLQSRSSSLLARMAELPRVDIGSTPSVRTAALAAGGDAAQMKSAYDQALGRTQR